MSVVSIIGPQAFAQKLLDASASGGPISVVTSSSGGTNTSVAVAYSIRQLKTTYDHAAITPPAAVSGFTNSNTPLMRVRRSSDNGQLDIGYLASGMLDTVTLKDFVSTGNGFVSVWYDQSGNSRDAVQGNTSVQPRIVNSGVVDVNQSGVPGMQTINGQRISDASVTSYGITDNRTLNVVCQAKTYTNGSVNGCCGTYALDRSPIAGDNPLTSIKISSDKWGLQIRTDAGAGLNASFESTIQVNTNRTDNLTAMRDGDTYSLEVNGISVGSTTVSGVNTMDPLKMGYGSIYTETVYYGEVLLFGSALSATNRFALNSSQNTFFNVGGGFVWTGATSNDWNTTSNWANSSIPTEGSNVIVPSGTTNALIITSLQTTLKARKIQVNSGATVTINGNLSVSDSVISNGTITGTGTLTMNGVYRQYINGVFGNLTNSNSTDTIYASGDVTVNGTLINPAAGKIDFLYYNFIGSSAIISNSGNIYSRSFSNPPLPTGKTWGGTVTYTGTTGGRYIVDGTYNNLVMNNSSGTNNATGNIIVNDSLTTTAGGTFSMSTYALSGSLTSITNPGTISTANTSSTPFPAGKTWNGTVRYAVTTGGQTVVSGTYTNLTLSNTSGTQTAGGAINLNGTLTTQSGGSFDMTIYQLSGSSATILNSGTIRTANTANPPLPTGKTWGGTMVYYAASAGQTIANGTYNNLTLSNNSGMQKTAGGDLVVDSALTFSNYSLLNMGTYVLSGGLTNINIINAGEIQTANTSANPLPSGKGWGSASLVTYNAPSGGQTVVAGTYTHLQLANTSGTQTANGNLAIDQIFTIAVGATLNMGAYTLSGNMSSLQAYGTIQTAVLSAPFPTGKTWAGTINYNSPTGGQTIVSNATYTNLTMGNTSGTQTADGNLTVNDTLTTTAGGTLSMGTNTFSGTLGTITNNGTISTLNTTTTPLPSGKTWGGTGGITYAATTGAQTIVTGTYNSLSLSNTSGTNTVSGNIMVNGTLTTTAGGILDMVIYTLGGTMAGVSNNGTLKTINTSSTPIPAGKTWGGTVEYNASANQTIVSGTYNNLTISGSGTKYAGGDFVLNGTLIRENIVLDMGIYALSGAITGISNSGVIYTANTSSNPLPSGKYWGNAGWVIYNAPTGGQTVVGGTFTHLSMENTSGTQTVSGDLSIDQRFIITAGGTLNMGTYILTGLITSPEVSGTLSITNTSATPIPSRNWTAKTGTVLYNATAGGQTVVTGTYYKLTMGNTSNTNTAGGNITVANTLNTTTGGTLNLGTNTLSGLLVTITNDGTIITSNTTATPLASGKTWGGTGTVNYAVTTGDQTIVSGTYNNLLLSNTSNTNTAGGNIGVNGTLTISGGGTFDLTNYQLTGSLATIANNGTLKTANMANPPLPAGEIWGGTVEYYAPGAGQTISNGTYNNLNMSSSGTNTAGGDLTVNGTITTAVGDILNMSTYLLSGTLNTIANNGEIRTANISANPIPSGKTWGSTVRYSSVTGGQTVANGNYINLYFDNTSGTQTVNGNIVVDFQLITSAGGTLSMGIHTLSGTLSSITNNGTINTANTSSTPIPTGKTWGGTINYTAAIGGQTIVSGTYNNLRLDNTSGSQSLTSNLTVNGTLTTTAGGTLDMGTRSLGGTLAVITNNGTIRTARTAGGSALPNGKTWGGTGTVEYYATTGAQTIPDGTYNNLTISNTSGIQTVNDNLVVNNTLTTTTGGTLNMGTRTLSGNLTTITNNGTIQISNTSATPVAAAKTWGGSGTVQYAVTGGGQTVVEGTYYNLTSSNSSGTNTASGNLVVNGTLTTTTGGILSLNTYTLSGTLNTITNNGRVRTANTSASPLTAGKTWNGTVEYSAGSGAQTIANGTYNNLLMSNSSGTQSLNGPTTVGGTMTFSGGKLTIGSNTLNINGTLSGHSATASLVANGSSNLVIGGSGALGANLFFDQTNPGTSNRLNDITYNRASQTITLGNALQVIGTVTPTAGTFATGNLLTLTSTATATARIAAGSGSYITGNLTAERYIPSVARRFRFMASPVSGSTLADWKNEIYITGAGGATNGFDPTATNAPSVYYYDESIPGDNNTNGWVAATNTNLALTPGKGFRVFIRGDRSDPNVLTGTTGTQAAVTMNVINPVNTGNVTMPVSFTSSGNASYDGWSFVGNPYPSPIDWNAFHDAGRTGSAFDYSGTDYAHLDAVIYIYDPAVNGYTSFNAFSGAHTGSMTNGVIPSGGAFWVKAAAVSPAMTMKEVYKTGTASTGAVFKTQEQDQFTIKLLSSVDEKLYDEAAIKYVTEATGGFDAYDIRKMFGAEVNIASVGTDGSILSANYKPFNGKSDTIMLSMGVAKSGAYTFEFSNTSLLVSGVPVYLIDAFTQTVVDLTTTSTYTFSIDKDNATSLAKGRFVIVVGDLIPVETFMNEVMPATLFSVYPTLTKGKVTISNSNQGLSDQNVTVTITDMTGKKMEKMQLPQWNSHQLVLDLGDYKSGAYIISIQSPSANAAFKCIKYE
ncbi:MAG: T9SS type A sorting domain-containing protein [Bacteroidota bacterium]